MPIVKKILSFRNISRNQQMLRFDAEVTNDLNKEEEMALLKQISNFIEHEDPNILIFEDYNKGVLTEKVIEEAITLCRASGVITAVDPKRKNFFNYRYVDIFKPNMKEVQEGLHLLFETTDIYQLRNFEKATPTAAIVAVCITAKKLQPYRNPAKGLYASFK